MSHDAADALSNIVNQLNKEVGPIPPGPAREAKMEVVVRRYLANAKDERSRKFFEAMLPSSRRKP